MVVVGGQRGLFKHQLTKQGQELGLGAAQHHLCLDKDIQTPPVGDEGPLSPLEASETC